MWDELRQKSAEGVNFALHRWENPLNENFGNEMQGRLWPSTEDFYHPLNPMFSFFIRTQQQLDIFKVVLLRDGAQTLLEFFLRFPSPKPSSPQLLVQADLWFLVPAAWRPRTLGWRMETTNGEKPPATADLLFYGLLCDSFLAGPLFMRHLDGWLEQFPSDAPVSAYFTQRSDLFDPPDQEWLTIFELPVAFQRRFRQGIRFIRRSDLQATTLPGGCTYVDMDLWRHGIALSSIESQMMGRGFPLHPRGHYSGFTGEKLGHWPLSFQHGLTVYRGEAQHDDFGPFFFLKKTAPNKHMALPHPIKSELHELLHRRLKVSGVAPASA